MDVIAKTLNQAFITDKIQLLKMIANDYKLDADELIDKYIDKKDTETINVNTIIPAKKPVKKRNDFIETEEVTYENTTYLVDNKNQVYTYNVDRPMLIGERLIDGTIKFFEAYKKYLQSRPSTSTSTS